MFASFAVYVLAKLIDIILCKSSFNYTERLLLLLCRAIMNVAVQMIAEKQRTGGLSTAPRSTTVDFAIYTNIFSRYQCCRFEKMYIFYVFELPRLK